MFALSSRTNGESKLDCGEGFGMDFRVKFSAEILLSATYGHVEA